MTDDLVQIAHRALAVTHPPQYRYLPNGRWKRRGDLWLSAAGLPGPVFNKATVFNSATTIEQVFAAAGDFFDGITTDYGVMLDANVASPVEDALRAAGWQLIDEEPGMVLAALPSTIPPSPPELTIRRVIDDVTLRDFWSVSAPPGTVDQDAVDAPLTDPFTDLTRYFNPSVACALDPEIGLFTGYVDGRAVATAAVYRADGIAEIGAVATRPDSRRRGYGAALTWAAVAEGAARGWTAAALRASELGYSVYLHMGFVTAATIRLYVRG